MEHPFVHAATVFMGFFAIMNPIANTPIFLGLLGDEDPATTRAVALKAVALAFLIVTLFAVAGKLIFELFGITLDALRITGGLLVLLIGFHMLQGENSSVHHLTDAEGRDAREAAMGVAVSPLAMPLLAGPGTIATAMNFSAQGGMLGVAVTIAAFGVLCGITYLLFVSGRTFVRFVGAGVLGVVTRLMGLILAVIGTQMLIQGLHGAFPALG